MYFCISKTAFWKKHLMSRDMKIAFFIFLKNAFLDVLAALEFDCFLYIESDAIEFNNYFLHQLNVTVACDGLVPESTTSNVYLFILKIKSVIFLRDFCFLIF